MPSDKEPFSLWRWLGASAPQITIISLVVAPLLTLQYFMSGGLRPQAQVDIDQLRSQLAADEKVVSAMQTALQSQLAVLQSRLDALPKPTDLEAHLAKLDAGFETERDQMTTQKYDIKSLQDKYTALTTVPAPPPGRRP